VRFQPPFHFSFLIASKQSSSSITKVRVVAQYWGRKPCFSQPIPALEEFHNTPDTQTDQSYIHPEDIEHFAQHETIEITEAEREAIFQGITVEEALAQHMNPAGSNNPPTQQVNTDNQEVPKKIERIIPLEKQDPVVRFSQAKAESAAHSEWGTGNAGYTPPRSASERMRKNLPYKVMLPLLCSEFLLEVDIGTYAVQVPSELGRFLT
jgi:hypothetical protein